MNERIRSIAEQCSQPKSVVHKEALFQLRPYVEGFLDANWLEIELKKYENWASKNSDSFLQYSLLHRPTGFNILVASIWAAREWERIYSKEDSTFRLSGGAAWLLNVACSLAVLEYCAGQWLDLEAREHLRQRLQEAKKQVWGVINELHTFAYFVRKGAKVDPYFLKKASPEEIIIHWYGVDIPVQCKAKPPGSGRIIFLDTFTDLACRIARDVKIAGKRLLVCIGSTNELRDEDIEVLRHQVSRGAGLGIGATLVTNKNRAFSVKSELLSGQFTVKTVGNYLSKFKFHTSMVIGEPEQTGNAFNVVAVVGIEANLTEKRAWNSLKASIKKGGEQLKNGLPGVVAIYYADPVNNFEYLCPFPGQMKVFIGRIIDRLPRIGAVILASEPNLQYPRAGEPGHISIYYKKPWPFPQDFLTDDSS